MKKTTVFRVLLLAIGALAAVFYVRVALDRWVEYDGFWHVFIASQDRLRWFLRDLAGDAHPPLFYVLLRIPAALSRTRLSYRVVPLASAVGSIFLVGRLARDLGADRAVAALAAFTFAFSIDVLVMGNEVRSYMLATALALLATDFLVRAVRSGARAGVLLPVAAASACAMAALLADYSSVFVLSAAVAAAAPFVVRDRPLRDRVFEKRAAAWIAACGAAAVLPAAAFFRLARQGSFARPIGYLSPFYLAPRGTESLPAFLFRNARNEAALFLPVSAKSPFVPFAVAVVVTGTILASRGAGRRRRLAGFPALVLGLASAEIAAAAVAGLYPFGGSLRQQFVLFPFVVLAGAIAVQGFTSRIRSRSLRAAVIAVPAVAVAVNFALRVGPYLKPGPEVVARNDAIFRSMFPDPPVVYADQYSVVALFAGRDRWEWTAQGALRGEPGADVYRVSGDARSFLLVRDRTRWNVDFGDPRFYALLRRSVESLSAKSVTVFGVVDRGGAGPFGPEEAESLRERIRLGSSAAGLTAGRIVIRGRNVFFELAANH